MPACYLVIRGLSKPILLEFKYSIFFAGGKAPAKIVAEKNAGG